uniref:Uncharacterized protein n=1 Tax=Meloidogyne hapla TaxID=6305 RepID=A0A1I8BT61_MELHA
MARLRLINTPKSEPILTIEFLASSGDVVGGIGSVYPNELVFKSFSLKIFKILNEHNSPFSPIRESKFYHRHRSTAELPTSARGAQLYDCFSRCE